MYRTSKVPFLEFEDAATIMHTICNRGKPNMRQVRSDCPPVLKAFMDEGIAFEPERRPTFAELAQRFCPLDVFLAKHLEVDKKVRAAGLSIFKNVDLFLSQNVPCPLHSSCETCPTPCASDTKCAPQPTYRAFTLNKSTPSRISTLINMETSLARSSSTPSTPPKR